MISTRNKFSAFYYIKMLLNIKRLCTNTRFVIFISYYQIVPSKIVTRVWMRTGACVSAKFNRSCSDFDGLPLLRTKMNAKHVSNANHSNILNNTLLLQSRLRLSHYQNNIFELLALCLSLT